MKRRVISLLLTLTMLVPLMAACGGSTGGTTTGGTTTKGSDKETDKPSESEGGDLDPYEFTLYYNYDWWTIKPWGEDETSKYWKEKFNIQMNQEKPDSDVDAKFNLMLTTGELPDAIQMERSADWRRAAGLGVFIDLAPLQAANPSFDNEILESTRELLKIDGVLYSMPHWARKNPTGGNYCWIINKSLWEKAGSPELKTLEDIYEFATYVKENIPETDQGLPTIPYSTEPDQNRTREAFWRSFGGPSTTTTYTARLDGKMQSIVRSDIFRKTILEVNKWWREGLMPETMLSDTRDQFVEKLANGRVAVSYYDFSLDDTNHFRQLLVENNNDDYIILTDPVYPPAEGVSHVYADHKESVGWNVINITKDAEKPQRIFDLFSHLLTKEGSREMMYGPKGFWWNETDADGNPILEKAESQYTAEEKDKIGSWFWSFLSHSDNVDNTKFAVNAQQPKENQSWVISAQADIFSPIMFMSDEYVLLDSKIDPADDLGIARKLCEDEYAAQVPKAMMASSAEEANQIIDDLIAFLDANRFAEVEAIYDERHQEIVDIQGFSAFDEN